MKRTKQLLLPTIALLFVVLSGGCKKEIGGSGLTRDTSSFGISKTSPTQLKTQSQIAGVNLGVAGDFVILSKSGITDVYKSTITGDVGSSPITGAAILVTCTEVTGTIYSVDAAGPLPCTVNNATRLTTAVGDMQTAYTDAAGITFRLFRENRLVAGSRKVG